MRDNGAGRISRRHFLASSAAGLTAVAVAPRTAGGTAAPSDSRVLMIAEQGSFFVGGEKIFTETGNDTSVMSSRNPGHANINQSYVKYQIPLVRESKYPLILYPGGGHEGKVYETTPDGREGWATYFLRRGFPVYNVDGVNRGASSYDITNVVLVSQGVLPPSAIPRMNRYTYEAAWTQFRIGPSPGVQNEGGQFPVEAFEEYTNQLVPAFRDAIEDDKNVAALVALLERIGPAIVLTWSQSGRFGFRAAVQRPGLVKAMVALEPAAVSPAGVMTGVSAADLASIAHIPILLVCGDFDAPRISTLQNFAGHIGGNATLLVLPEHGISGNGHVMMVERNNLRVADFIIAQLKERVNVKK